MTNKQITADKSIQLIENWLSINSFNTISRFIFRLGFCKNELFAEVLSPGNNLSIMFSKSAASKPTKNFLGVNAFYPWMNVIHYLFGQPSPSLCMTVKEISLITTFFFFVNCRQFQKAFFGKPHIWICQIESVRS